jgi:hypothetical protein
MTQAITGKSTFQGILTSPVTGAATYAGPNSNNGTVQTVVANQATTFVASSPIGKASYVNAAVSAPTGLASYGGPNSNNGTVQTVVTAKNTPQS